MTIRTPTEILQDERRTLLHYIEAKLKRISGFRLFNVCLFTAFRTLIPVGSAVVAGNVLAMAQGKGFLTPTMALCVAATVTVVSGLDAILNPSSKKTAAYDLLFRLESLASEVRVMEKETDPQALAVQVASTREAVGKLLHEYVGLGY